MTLPNDAGALCAGRRSSNTDATGCSHRYHQFEADAVKKLTAASKVQKIVAAAEDLSLGAVVEDHQYVGPRHDFLLSGTPICGVSCALGVGGCSRGALHVGVTNICGS